MKISALQLSNILSFKYVDDVSHAEKIIFDDDLNIIIGENGSGKSTALEVINFVFRRVLYKQYNLNEELYSRRSSVSADEKRQVLQPANNNSYAGFRLDPNWNTEDKPQTIRIVVRLDEIDRKNLENLERARGLLFTWVEPYTTRGTTAQLTRSDTYTLNISLNRNGKQFTVHAIDCAQDFGYEYLTDYNFFKETIALYNFENPSTPIETLYESFTLIGGYRNYHSFNASISLRDNHPAEQIRQIRSTDFSRSLNANESAEPAIFALVRLRVAELHFASISKRMDESECEAAANALPFLREINQRLRVVNLVCKIRLTDLRTWQYSFEFLDLRRNKAIADINSLSAGQKAITHLVFEAYGRGNLKGGLVVIDEPEIHLHYQFQHEYLQVIRELNRVQNCQYVLVTHSEALINSATISHVRRFSLNPDGYTVIKSPKLTTEQKLLIRILDNTRSTYAFFAKKVVLVEGDSDRYFFKAMIQLSYARLDQEIAVLHVAGKKELAPWTSLFEAFGLIVYRVADLDYAFDLFYPSEMRYSLKTQVEVNRFRTAHADCDTKIEAIYVDRTYVLKNGDLEHYLGIRKDLAEVIAFCGSRLPQYLTDNSNANSLELRSIVQGITA